MTTPTDNRRIQTTAGAAQTVFTYDFKIVAKEELRIELRAVADDTVTLLVEGSGNDYTVTGVGDAGGGTFVLAAGATVNDVYTCEGLTVINRGVDYSSALRSSTLNADGDEVYRILSEIQRTLDRTIRMPLSDNDGVVLGSDMVLPIEPDRDDSFLKFDADGKVVLVAAADLLVGPATSTDSAVPRWDGTTGLLLQDSGVIIDDSDNITGVAGLALSGVILGPAGTAGAPMLSKAGDPNTGLFFPAADQIGLATGGTNRVLMTTTELTLFIPVTIDSASNAKVTLLGSLNPRIVFIPTSGDQMFIDVAGGLRFRNATAGRNDLAFDADGLATFGGAAVIFQAGTAAAPAMTKAGDLDTGIYFPAANQFAITAAGARQVNFTGVASAVNYLDIRGAIAGGDPALTMTGTDTDVGLSLVLKGAGVFDVAGMMTVTHLAAGPDDHALEIDIDAAGFGDVKALGIAYGTGAIGAGSDEAVILVNIDESASTGGEVFGLEVIGTDFGSANLIGLKAGVNVAPIRQLSGTFGNADSILVLAVDQLTALSSGGAGNIATFVADNDTITISDAAKFEELEFDIDTPASGAGIAPVFEYSTGVGTWAVFVPVDGTNGFKNTGVVIWDDADIPAWAVGTGTEFLIRITRTRNALSTTPILDLIQITAATEYSWSAAGVIDIAKLIVGAGTEALPAVSAAGDPNTGLFFPAADQIGLATGGTNRVLMTTTELTLFIPVTIDSASNAKVTLLGSLNPRIVFIPTSGDQMSIDTAGGLRFRNLTKARNDLSFDGDGNGTFGANVRLNGDLDLTLATGILTDAGSLPTSDPSVAGQLWNNAGVVTVS